MCKLKVAARKVEGLGRVRETGSGMRAIELLTRVNGSSAPSPGALYRTKKI